MAIYKSEKILEFEEGRLAEVGKFVEQTGSPIFTLRRGCGGMVDTLVLGTSAAMREGSSPFIRTSKIQPS